MNATIERAIAYLDQYEQNWPLSGNVLIAQNGEIVFEKSLGYANLEHAIANRPSTKFGIWSITKSFTAMSLALLEENKRLRLDDHLSDYIPSFKRYEPITIRQLMQHTSGMPNFTSLPEFNSMWNKWTLAPDKWLQLLDDKPLHFSPGTAFSYNNTGYYLLGKIIEMVSGEPFHQFVQRRILDPLEMKDTGVNDGKTVITGLASPYQASGGEPRPCEFVEMSTVSAAGGMYSTAQDLLKWDQSFYTGQLLAADKLSYWLDLETEGYGLGWFQDSKFGKKRIFHGGAYRGYRSELHRFPEENATIILLTNYDYIPVTKIADALGGSFVG
ncbi:serine hydrolase domain-containing protein [Paenibacillus sp. GCM10027627]|uniref:serine hydrolase domain-containing protein n=1 Tax=unclassified Paenibacillus TaxID=185978 RepID=UPI00363068D9